jgi:nitrogen regulatory protein PII
MCRWIMKQLTIVIKPFRAEAVLKAISESDVIACVVVKAARTGRIGDGKIFAVNMSLPEPLEF